MATSLPLEQELTERIIKAAHAEPELSSLSGVRRPEDVTRKEIESFQFSLLRKTLSYMQERSPFYRDLFQRQKVNPEKIRTPSDLAKLPFTHPSDLGENPNRFVCVSMADIIRPITFVSSGTTGPEKRVLFTESDLEIILDFLEVGMRTVAGPGDVVQVMLPGGAPLGQLHLLSEAVERIGATAVRAGTALTAEEQIELIKAHGSTVLFGRTGRIYHMTQELRRMGTDLDKLGVRILFLSSEYLPPAMRTRLEQVWNCEVSFHYGMSEMGLGVGVECDAHDGFHFKEWDLILEVINPETGDRVAEGEEGELVFTTLTREGMPLLRYRSHDVSRLIPEPCRCRSQRLLKFAPPRYRLEGLLRLGEDDFIYSGMLDERLYELEEVVDYQVQLSKSTGGDTLDLVVEVTDISDGLSTAILKKVMGVPVMEKNLALGRMATPKIELVPLNQLQRKGSGKKLIFDTRL